MRGTKTKCWEVMLGGFITPTLKGVSTIRYLQLVPSSLWHYLSCWKRSGARGGLRPLSLASHSRQQISQAHINTLIQAHVCTQSCKPRQTDGFFILNPAPQRFPQEFLCLSYRRHVCSCKLTLKQTTSVTKLWNCLQNLATYFNLFYSILFWWLNWNSYDFRVLLGKKS